MKSWRFGESRGRKSLKSRTQPSRHVKMFVTKSVTSLRQTRSCRSNGIWPVTMHEESWRQSADTNHESPRRDLCHGLSWFVSSTFPAGKFRWKSQSQRNGIWALTNLDPICRVHLWGPMTYYVRWGSLTAHRRTPKHAIANCIQTLSSTMPSFQYKWVISPLPNLLLFMIRLSTVVENLKMSELDSFGDK